MSGWFSCAMSGAEPASSSTVVIDARRILTSLIASCLKRQSKSLAGLHHARHVQVLSLLLYVTPATHVVSAPRIDTKRAGASGIKREKVADHRDVLPKMDELVAALRRIGNFPEAMPDQSGNEREQRQQERGVARLEAGNERQAADGFDQPGKQR